MLYRGDVPRTFAPSVWVLTEPPPARAMLAAPHQPPIASQCVLHASLLALDMPDHARHASLPASCTHAIYAETGPTSAVVDPPARCPPVGIDSATACHPTPFPPVPPTCPVLPATKPSDLTQPHLCHTVWSRCAVNWTRMWSTAAVGQSARTPRCWEQPRPQTALGSLGSCGRSMLEPGHGPTS
eukprot:356347-Chlamydomonas_euryale.AAC.1